MCFARIIRVGSGNGARSTYTRRHHLSSGRRRAGHSSLMPKLPVLLLSLVCCSLPASARPIGVVQAGQPTGVGRVVATITTLEGTVHMPGVQVELRTSSPTGDRAREDDDRRRRAGHVSRCAARPLHRHGDAARASCRGIPRRSTFAPTTSRRCCSTSQLTFVLPDVEVARRRAVADRQRAAGVDERHAVGLGLRDRAARGRRLPEPAAAAARRRARARRPPAHQGRPADARARCRSAAPA